MTRARCPLGLRVLANMTGVAHNLPAVYTAAIALANGGGCGDCNDTYVAIDDVRDRLFPGASTEEDRLQDGKTIEESDAIGAIIANTKDAAFLLGVAYAYVLIGAINGKDGAQ